MNYARLKAPMDNESMREFRLAMDPVNAIAKSTPGFIWSLNHVDDTQRDEVTVLRDDPLLMPQLSLWKDLTSIQHFAFKSGHAMYLKRRKEWFTEPSFAVCWWRLSSLEPPTLKEAYEKCDYLQQHGPSETAFTFKSSFPMPSSKKT